MLETLALKYALRKVAPRIIPMSLPKCAENDFYSITVEIPALDYKFICREDVDGKAYVGWLWQGDDDGGVDVCLFKSLLSEHSITLNIEHYYKGWVFEYKSASSFLLSSLFSKHRLFYNREQVAQQWFNRRSLEEPDRIKVLEHFVNETKNDHRFQTSPLTLGAKIYSNRLIFHPERDSFKKHLQLVFDSLVESKDIEKKDGNYRLCARALITMSEYDWEVRKHLDSQNNAKRTHSLTLAIIFIGVANLMLQLAKWYLLEQP